MLDMLDQMETNKAKLKADKKLERNIGKGTMEDAIRQRTSDMRKNISDSSSDDSSNDCSKWT